MDSQPAMRQHLDSIIAGGGSLPALHKRWRDRYAADSDPFLRRATKAWVAQVGAYRHVRHWGKFRRAIMLGAAVLGRPFLVDLERRGLLLADDTPRAEFSTSLRILQRQLADIPEDVRQYLNDRLRTYRAYDELTLFIHGRAPHVRRLLAERPFPFGRTLLSFTNLAFLRRHFAFEAGSEFTELFAEHDTPERLAEAASSVIALANDHRQLESADFTFPLTGMDVSDEFVAVLRYGAAICLLRETGKLISILSYRLCRERTGNPRVYRLCPSDIEVEYALRLGYIRGEIGTAASPLRVAGRADPRHSMHFGTKDLLNRVPQIAELRDPGTPFRRVRLHAPSLPRLYETLSRVRFYEDALRDERLSQELELPMRVSQSESWQLVPGIELHTFQKMWRSLEFLAFLDVAALRQFESDPEVIYNSLMRVSTEDNLVELLKVIGVDSERVAPLLDLIAADVRRLGHYDMQYRPFLRVRSSTARIGGRETTTRPEVIHGSAIVATSNITTNVQRAHGIRIRTNADAFVAVAQETLKSIFQKVRTNVAVKLGDLRTDVDIMILTERTLYLIECKHSVTPTGAHELRDLWCDINHGVRQLKVAMEILAVCRQTYLAGLFPGTTRTRNAGLRVQPCVLCSHRVFSGLSLGGIPVRDFASLALVCGDGIVAMGGEDESREVVMQRYRLRATENATEDDFDDYLSDGSRFFAMFRPFMHEHDRLYRFFEGSLILAHNTFVHSVSQDEWAAHLAQIGAVPMSPERHPVEDLWSSPSKGVGREDS